MEHRGPSYTGRVRSRPEWVERQIASSNKISSPSMDKRKREGPVSGTPPSVPSRWSSTNADRSNEIKAYLRRPEEQKPTRPVDPPKPSSFSNSSARPVVLRPVSTHPADSGNRDALDAYMKRRTVPPVLESAQQAEPSTPMNLPPLTVPVGDDRESLLVRHYMNAHAIWDDGVFSFVEGLEKDIKEAMSYSATLTGSLADGTGSRTNTASNITMCVSTLWDCDRMSGFRALDAASVTKHWKVSICPHDRHVIRLSPTTRSDLTVRIIIDMMRSKELRVRQKFISAYVCTVDARIAVVIALVREWLINRADGNETFARQLKEGCLDYMLFVILWTGLIAMRAVPDLIHKSQNPDWAFWSRVDTKVPIADVREEWRRDRSGPILSVSVMVDLFFATARKSADPYSPDHGLCPLTGKAIITDPNEYRLVDWMWSTLCTGGRK